MKTAILLVIVAALSASGIENPWAKVRSLKSGTELRIVKKGSAQPVMAKFDEATDDKLLVVVKNEQVAIAKEDIDRVDYRPVGGSRLKPESKATVENPSAEKPPAGPPSIPRPQTSVSSGLTIGSKPDFQTIYRRQVGAQLKDSAAK